MSKVRTNIADCVALIEIDNPPVNASSQAVRQGLDEAVAAAQADPAVTAIVIACAGRTFVAGADITEFGKPPLAPALPDVLNRIEASAKPVVAALHGTALGGGFEIALACHARVIDIAGRVGLPETKLGIVPGAGGTQRLPRLAGQPAAIDMIASGRMVDAKEALRLGVVDAIADGDLRAAAVAHARSLIGQTPRRTGAQTGPAFDEAAYAAAESAALKRLRGQTAPAEAARLVRLSATTSLAEGMAEERRTMFALMQGEQSKALRHVFFAEREAAKIAGLDKVAARAVAKVGIVGAGTMGAGIAVAFLDAGHDVTIVETSEQALEAGRKRVAGLYDRSIASGRLSEEGKAQRLARAHFAADLAALADVDLVVEAVFEDMAVKVELLGKLEAVVRPDCVLATNTSYLDIDAMAGTMHDPARLLGMHFFSPAHVMKLLEIVRAKKTSDEAVATAVAVGKKLKKIYVVAGVCDGFIGNRILGRYRQECEFMLEEGALPKEIDAAFEAYGFPMGPFAVSDLAGLDIAWARRKRLAPLRKAGDRYVPLADRICDMGRFGQKTGRGWYLYDKGKRSPDPEIEAMVRDHAAATGRPQQTLDAATIMSRVIHAMADEGAKILAEGIAQRESDVDIVMINGYGFPAWKGGPMFQARLARGEA